MGLFSKFKKSKNMEQMDINTPVEFDSDWLNIASPIDGKVIDIENVPDIVFSEKIVGDGVALEITGDKVVAPVDGIIGKVFDTKHAFSIISNNGVEIFINIGIDTVELKGKGFDQLKEDGDTVKKGDTILKLDLDFLEKNIKSTITSVVITNIDIVDTMDSQVIDQEVKAGEEAILNVKLK